MTVDQMQTASIILVGLAVIILAINVIVGAVVARRYGRRQ